MAKKTQHMKQSINGGDMDSLPTGQEVLQAIGKRYILVYPDIAKYPYTNVKPEGKAQVIKVLNVGLFVGALGGRMAQVTALVHFKGDARYHQVKRDFLMRW